MGHKKNKNKQSKAAESVSTGVREPLSVNHNPVNGTEQNHQSPISETADVQNGDVQKTDVDLNKHGINDTNISIPLEAEKRYWLHREASLEQVIKALQGELDAHRQKEADLETKILELRTEKDSWLQKETGYEGKFNELVDEIATLRSMGNSNKETIVSMNINNTRLQAQVIELEASRRELFHENQQLKEKMSNLQSQIQNLENTVAAHLQSERIMHASEKEEINSQLEAAQSLVDKLLSENEKLVEKVNDLNAELDRRSVTAESSLSVGSDPTVRIAETAGIVERSPLGTDFMVESAKPASFAQSSALRTDPVYATAERPESVSLADPILSDQIIETMEDDIIKFRNNAVNYMNSNDTDLMPNSRESIEEIVQIPLEENIEVVKVTELEASDANEKDDVPLTDAPFRFISFVARYVSGANLVNKSSSER